MPSRCWSWRISICMFSRSFLSSAPNGSSSSSTEVRSPARARAPRAAAVRQTVDADSARRKLRAAPSRARPRPSSVPRPWTGLRIFEAERDVVRDVEMREQRVVLEQHPDIALVHRDLVHRLALDGDGARGRLDQARRSCASRWSCRSRSGRAGTARAPARRRTETSLTASDVP